MGSACNARVQIYQNHFYRVLHSRCCFALAERHRQINDALLRTLEAEREGTPIAVEDDGDENAKDAPSLLDLDGGNDDPLEGKVCSCMIVPFAWDRFSAHQTELWSHNVVSYVHRGASRLDDIEG